jgi:hypothetical protein
VSDQRGHRLAAAIFVVVAGVQHVDVGNAAAPTGVILELGGIAIALWGVDELSADLFPGQPLPHRAGGRLIKRGWRLVKRRLGFKPPARVVQLGTALMEVSALGGVRAFSTKPRPSDAASLTEWNEYWDSRLGNLADQIGWLKQDMKKADHELGARVSAESDARSAAVSDLQQRMRTAIGGQDGRGLVKTWWGLALTFVGVLLQGLG